jgi:CSLREA domain-containing protein
MKASDRFTGFLSQFCKVKVQRLVILGALVAVSSLIPAPARAAATFTVNITSDTVDATPGDGICADAGGNCSLRAAIMETNALAGADAINVPAGTYTLTIPGTGETASATGDLNIMGDLTIIGAGGNADGNAADTIIQAGTGVGNGIDRVMGINVGGPGPLSVTIKAVTVRYGKTTVSGSTIGGGAGIYYAAGAAGGGNLSLYNVVVSDNTADASLGGGVVLGNLNTVPIGTATIEKSTIANNTALDNNGGGIYASNIALTIRDSTISGNQNNKIGRATSGGGLYSVNGTTLTVERSTFSGNRANDGSAGDGGAIFMHATTGAVTLVNSTFSGNYAAGKGGAIYWDSPSLTARNLTITANQAAGVGGGIHRNTGTTFVLHNSIVYGNTASAGADINGTVDTGTYTIVGNTAGTTGIVDGVSGNKVGVNPLLSPLGNYGGPTQTYKLLNGSPAMDAGTNALAPALDQRGLARILDSADSDSTATVDLGAVEVFPTISDLGNQSGSAGTPVVVPFSVGDASKGVSVTAASDNQTVVPNANLFVQNGSTYNPTLSVTGVAAGAATITVTVSAGGDSMSDTFVMTVTGQADLMVSKSHTGNFHKGGSGTYTVTVTNQGSVATSSTITLTDSPPVGMTITSITGSAWTCNIATGVCTRTLAIGPGAASTLSVTVSIATDAASSLTNSVTVSGGNDAVTTNNTGSDTTPISPALPIAVNDSRSTNEDAALTIAPPGILSNDTDSGSFAITAVKVTDPSNGTLTLNSNGSFTYTPNSNYSGSDIFTYTARSVNGDSAPATVTLTVNPVNDAPAVGTNAGLTVAEGASGTIGQAQLHTTDVDNVPADLIYTLKIAPAHGTLKNNGAAIAVDGTFTQDDINADQIAYVHDGSETTSDSFTFDVSDGALSVTGTQFTITVNPVNDAPVAVNDAYSTDEDTPLTVDTAHGVLANDTDSDSPHNVLTATIAAGPAHGSLTLNSDGSFTYTPTADYNGSDSFTYKANDGALDSNVATVTLTVNPVNDAPAIGTNAGLTMAEGTSGTIGQAQLQTTDVDNVPAGLIYTLKIALAYGTLNNNGAAIAVDGTFTQADINADQITYVHDGSETTSDSFSFDVSDGALSVTGTQFTITVNPVNGAPVAVNDAYSTDEDTPLTVDAAHGVLANDTDSDSPHNVLTATIAAGPAHGSLTLNSDGSFTYTSTADYNGSDSFTYKANDGALDSNVATVTLTVNPVNDAPGIGTNAGLTMAEGTSGTIGQAQLQTTDVDNVPADLIYTLKIAPAHGTLKNNGAAIAVDGTFTQADINADQITYVHDGSETTSDGFTFDVTDGALSVTGTHFAVTVTRVNDAPVAVNNAYSTNEDTALIVNVAQGVLANDTDGDSISNTISAIKLTDPTNGSLTFNNNGTFTYTPNAEYSGIDSFTYKANDTALDSTTATVTLTVNPVDDEPVISANAGLTLAEGDTATIGQMRLETTDIDSPAANLTYTLKTAPANGVLKKNDVSLAVNGTFTQADINADKITYVHNGSETVSDSFTFDVSDGQSSITATAFAVTVSPVNDAPVAVHDSYSTDRNTRLTVNAATGLLSNDSDSENDAFIAVKVTDPAHGTLSSFADDGSFTYTPDVGYSGTDSFTYKANDRTSDSNTASVTITVTTPSSNNNNNNNNNGSTKEGLKVNVETGDAGQGSVVLQMTVTRETGASGHVKDEMTFTEDNARNTVEKLLELGTQNARIVIPDTAAPVSEVNVNIPKVSHQLLAKGNVDLEIATPNVAIHIPGNSMEALTDDLFFRVVPVKDEKEKKAVEDRAKQEPSVQNVAKGLTVQVLGTPMTIETNMQNKPVTLLMPLGDSLPKTEPQRQLVLDNLVVFIEHSDGTKEVIKGKLATNKDGSLGVEFSINKFSTFTLVYAEGSKDYFAAQNIVHEAYISGYDDGTFKPERQITRAEIAVLLSRLAGLETKAGASAAYSDVRPERWAAAAIQAVTNAGLMSGYKDGSFHPDKSITRAEISVVIARWKALRPVDGSNSALNDIAGHWAESYIQAVELSSWISGYPGGTFKPDRGITRAEAVVLLNRVLGRGPLHGVQQSPWKDVPATYWAAGYIFEASVDHKFDKMEDSETYHEVKPS